MTIRSKTPFEDILYESNREVRRALHHMTDRYNAVARQCARQVDALEHIIDLDEKLDTVETARIHAKYGLEM